MLIATYALAFLLMLSIFCFLTRSLSGRSASIDALQALRQERDLRICMESQASLANLQKAQEITDPYHSMHFVYLKALNSWRLEACQSARGSQKAKGKRALRMKLIRQSNPALPADWPNFVVRYHDGEAG